MISESVPEDTYDKNAFDIDDNSATKHDATESITTDKDSDSCDDNMKAFDCLPASKTSALKRRLSKYLRSRYLTRKSVLIMDKTMDTSHLISIDARSHLEVSDPKHRYGKNLRLYYDAWVKVASRSISLSHVSMSSDEPKYVSPFTELNKYESFFTWLDDPKAPPSIEGCSRETLLGDTVTYCKSSSDRVRYAIMFDSRGRLHRSSRSSLLDLDDDDESLLSTGKSGHIFVARDEVLYTHVKKVEKPPRFHHSSFFAGDVVEAAGILVCELGVSLVLYPHSGHYRPRDKHFLNFLIFLRKNHVDLAEVTVDVQRTLRTARLVLPGGEKVKKKDASWMWGALMLFDFLSVKVHAWDSGLFRELVQYAVDRSYLRRTTPQQQRKFLTEEAPSDTQGLLRQNSDMAASSDDDSDVDSNSGQQRLLRNEGGLPCPLCSLS